jgi:hypothetical protein
LAVVAVVLTTAAVAFLGWRFAGLPIAAAIALGAIVSPPDPVAANEVLRHLRIPQRIGLVLQGEGLLNDATALLIYRAAVVSAAGSFSLVADAPMLILPAVASLAAGYVLARLYLVASAFVRDPAGNTVLQFVSAFGVWLLSERLTLSPIITVVIYAMTLAQAAPRRLGPRLRISSYSVWETAVFVVNVLAFALMGLQARTIIERLSPEQRWGSMVFALGVLAAPSSAISPAPASSSCRRRSTAWMARRRPPQGRCASNTWPPARLPKTSGSRRLRPNTTNCGCARSLLNARRCIGCARAARSAMKPFAAFRRSSTGPSSMPRRARAFSPWQVEAGLLA